MKKVTIKSIVLLAMALVILSGAVGGTIAWITTQQGPVENVFTPGKVEVTVTDSVSGNVKSNVVITNTGNTDAYIRAAIVANWVKDGEIVAPWNGSVDINNGWVEVGGYYYFTTAVKSQQSAKPKLFNSYEATNAPVEGAHLEMDIIAQAIQAEGTTTNGTKAVVDAWAIDPESLGGSSATN